MIDIELATVGHLHCSTELLSTPQTLEVYSPRYLPLAYCRVLPLHPPSTIDTTLARPRRVGGYLGTCLPLVPVPPTSPPVRGGGGGACLVSTGVPTSRGRLDYSSSTAGTNMPGHGVAPVAQGSLSKKLTFPHRCGDEHISECVVMTTCVWSGPHVCGDHNTHVVMTTHMPDGTYVDITPPVWTSTNIILP